MADSDGPVAVVVGVGPGLGGALAERFAAGGYRVAALARSEDKVKAYADKTGGIGVTCDVTDPDDIRKALGRVRDELGPIRSLLWNVGSAVFGDVDEVGPDALDLGYHTNARGLLLAVQEALPDLRAQDGASIVITGATASLRGKPFTTAFAAGKAAQRSLAESFARQLWPEGIHVSLIIVDGMVDLPRTRERMPDKGDEHFVSPEGYAETAWFLAHQPPGAWTFQLEVRPAIESW